MVEEKKKQKPLTEVWGDTVNLKELLILLFYSGVNHLRSILK